MEGTSDKARQSLPGSWLWWESPFACWGPFTKTPGGMGVVKPQRELLVGLPGGPWGPVWVSLTEAIPTVSPGAGWAAWQVLVRGPQDRSEAAGLPGAEGGLGLSPAGRQHVSVTAAAPRRAGPGPPPGLPGREGEGT